MNHSCFPSTDESTKLCTSTVCQSFVTTPLKSSNMSRWANSSIEIWLGNQALFLDKPFSNIHQTLYIGPFKRIKYVGQTLSKIVGRNMFESFEQNNQTCWMVLNGVGRCWIKFDFVQTLHPTSSKTIQFARSKIRHNFVHGRSEERRVGKECRSRWSPDH